MEDTEEEPQMETGTAEDTEEVKTKDEEVKETVTPAHPYRDELSQFQPHSWQLEEKEPEMYSSLDDTKFTMVDSQSLLDEMMLKLKEVTELAIDLKDHSYRFHGMVCLLQISTRTEDFLIDPLILKEGLEVLNEVCTDSNILKVMHGSKRDIKWLQKDFGIYLINMFDTQKAAGALKEEGISLLEILKKYCKIDVNKEYQRVSEGIRGYQRVSEVDWRVRPLPVDMVKYAREDTHFLLYIHDVFRNSLLKKNALKHVYKVSTVSCGTVWHPDPHAFKPHSYMGCYKKNKGKLNIQQLECFRLLYEWRHNISKEKDESMGYTLPNKLLLKISKALPSEAQGIVNCCNPVPLLVEQNLEEIHKLILQAIINVPEVPKEPVKTSKEPKTKGQLLSAIKKNKMKHLKRSTCLACGCFGHQIKDCVNRDNIKHFGGMRPRLRGGAAWNRGRGALFGAYPPGGPGMRGGPGFQGRGPRPMGPMHMHSYADTPPRHPLRGDMYHSMDSYNAGPYNNGPFDPYNQRGAHPRFNAGGW